MISRAAAIAALRSLFTYKDSDTFTLDEIFRTAGRNLSQPAENKRWLINRLTPLKQYGLVESLYTSEQPKMLVGVRITPVGKEALESSENETSEPPARPISLESVVQIVREFQKQNPSAKVEFLVTMRKEEG